MRFLNNNISKYYLFSKFNCRIIKIILMMLGRTLAILLIIGIIFYYGLVVTGNNPL
tara:strand:- start:351 stop:518 length:168 start_codon:yes stop_codon:yes gene_type:complete